MRKLDRAEIGPSKNHGPRTAGQLDRTSVSDRAGRRSAVPEMPHYQIGLTLSSPLSDRPMSICVSEQPFNALAWKLDRQSLFRALLLPVLALRWALRMFSV